MFAFGLSYIPWDISSVHPGKVVRPLQLYPNSKEYSLFQNVLSARNKSTNFQMLERNFWVCFQKFTWMICTLAYICEKNGTNVGVEFRGTVSQCLQKVTEKEEKKVSQICGKKTGMFYVFYEIEKKLVKFDSILFVERLNVRICSENKILLAFEVIGQITVKSLVVVLDGELQILHVIALRLKEVVQCVSERVGVLLCRWIKAMSLN